MHMEDKATTIRIVIDDVVYNLETYEETSNILVYMEGMGISRFDKEPFIKTITNNKHCCVFSHLTDLLAYIALLKKDDKVCEDIDNADYMVIKPCNNYSLTYGKLKYYKEVHGFMRISKENRVVNSVLAGLLDCKFTNEDYRFQTHKALVSYCMDKFNALEI